MAGAFKIEKRRVENLGIASEFDLHKWTIKTLQRLAWGHVKYWHAASGEKRNVQTAGKLQAMGVIRGVPDLQIFIKHEPHFLELKYGKGELNEDQERFFRWCKEFYIPCEVARTQEEVLNVLERWQAIRPVGWQFRPAPVHGGADV